MTHDEMSIKCCDTCAHRFAVTNKCIHASECGGTGPNFEHLLWKSMTGVKYCKVRDECAMCGARCADCHDESCFMPHELPPLSDQGMKDDGAKNRLDLMPHGTINGIGEVLTFGAKKYAPNNWQKVEAWRYEGALMRHFEAWRAGEKNDSDSGLSHLKHVLCNAAFLLWKEEND